MSTPTQILTRIRNKLTGNLQQAATQELEPQVKTLQKAVSAYKQAMEKFESSLRTNNIKRTEKDGLKDFDEGLQDLYLQVIELGAKAQRLLQPAEKKLKQEKSPQIEKQNKEDKGLDKGNKEIKVDKKNQTKDVSDLFTEAQKKLHELEKTRAEEQIRQENEKKKLEEENKKKFEEMKKPAEKIQKAEEKIQRINNVIAKVDKIISAFKEETIGIGKNFPDARTTAVGLHDELRGYRDQYVQNLNDGPMTESEAGKIFKDACSVAITKAMPTLERDLGWGEYLKNLIKTIANAVVYVVTAGNKSSFFPYAKSTISESATLTKGQLKDHDKEEPKKTEEVENQQTPTPTPRG